MTISPTATTLDETRTETIRRKNIDGNRRNYQSAAYGTHSYAAAQSTTSETRSSVRFHPFTFPHWSLRKRIRITRSSITKIVRLKKYLIIAKHLRASAPQNRIYRCGREPTVPRNIRVRIIERDFSVPNIFVPTIFTSNMIVVFTRSLIDCHKARQFRFKFPIPLTHHDYTLHTLLVLRLFPSYLGSVTLSPLDPIRHSRTHPPASPHITSNRLRPLLFFGLLPWTGRIRYIVYVIEQFTPLFIR